MALISLDHVSKIYPRGTRPALDDVNLHIDRGDFVFLVGASGSGKTTLLSLLLREEEATGGEIHVAGNDLRRLTNRQVPQYRRSIGFIFQDYKLLNNKTVWQNVAFALEVIGTRRSTIKSLVPKVLETVGLTGKENSYPHELSGGEQQRVTIARAYVNHPQILLADEPTGNLDPTTSLGIMEVLDAINRTGTTIVMATHNEEIVNSMRKRVVELHAGQIVRDERQGSYDSALFFPDADVESKSKQALGMTDAQQSQAVVAGSAQPASVPAVTIDETTGTRSQQAERVVEHVSEVINSDETDEGIARLANSVHSGRTGRYGEVFAPVETTLTWGKGLRLEEYAAQQEAAKADAGEGDAESGVGSERADGSARPQTGDSDRSGDDAGAADALRQASEPSAVAETIPAAGAATEPPAPAPAFAQPVEQPVKQSVKHDDREPSTDLPDVPLPPMPPAPPAPPHARAASDPATQTNHANQTGRANDGDSKEETR
ncbi:MULTISPECIES: cell division ATP-binding protein FtsE [Bifidobacterium]|uniref:cell division ATP-binding protein FtsE n=1 Tax=Bifidobacterium TaxID=1678 RepID=UPI001BDC0D92|nr:MULTISPECIES: cell division ATP-binding protein FtsE [Bifidobacterium]MBT1162043.1 cell division ATP-binding protein FtsE [Bifidobacterium sp. SO1]MBW3078043.1 cell division ATP-binding protein FtsE [Bifidobacterium simiiventris]